MNFLYGFLAMYFLTGTLILIFDTFFELRGADGFYWIYLWYIMLPAAVYRAIVKKFKK